MLIIPSYNRSPGRQPDIETAITDNTYETYTVIIILYQQELFRTNMTGPEHILQ